MASSQLSVNNCAEWREWCRREVLLSLLWEERSALTLGSCRTVGGGGGAEGHPWE